MKPYAGVDVSLERSSVCVVTLRASRAGGQGGVRAGSADRLVWAWVSKWRGLGLKRGRCRMAVQGMQQGGLPVGDRPGMCSLR